jgi:hypothetical protein
VKRLRAVAGSLVAALLLMLQGSCVVRSVHPWFPASDAVFEPDLLGGWVGTSEGKDVAMTFVRAEEDGNAYLMQYQSGDARGNFRARLGKLSGEYYLDFCPVDARTGIDGLLLFPTHSVAKMELAPEKLVIRQMDYEVAKARAQRDRLGELKYAWDDENELLLSSRSDELRSFLVSSSRDKELYAPAMVLTRRKG